MQTAGQALRVATTPPQKPPEVQLPELAVLYREHSPFVWRNARRLGCALASVDDVVHEVFLVVARRLHEFRGEAQIRSWLFAITYHVVQRFRRDRARYTRRLEEYGDVRNTAATSQQTNSQEAGHDLRRMLLRLSEAKRLVFIMSELEGMTSLEIAQCLGMKAGTVDSRLRAARIELKTMLARETPRSRRFWP